MTDTAQPMLAAENVSLEQAADAFKSFLTQDEVPDQPRDEQGRFASTSEEPEAEYEIETDEEYGDEADDSESAADDEGEEYAEEEAEEAQPDDAIELPTSWSSDKAEVWDSLPREAQEYIAARDREINQAVNQKFQEAANIRKANEAVVNEANANRDLYLRAVDDVLSMVTPQKPVLEMLDTNSPYYNPDQYHMMNAQYEAQMQYVGQLSQQRQAIVAQQQAEMETASRAAYEAIEAQARPAFLADVPEVTDPVKGNAILNEIASYAIQLGIPAETFADPANASRITSAEFHMAWKAMQYDKIKAAEGRVKPNAKPRPASPALRPGPTATRQSADKTRIAKAQKRLANEGSIEAGAAVFRNIFNSKV